MNWEYFHAWGIGISAIFVLMLALKAGISWPLFIIWPIDAVLLYAGFKCGFLGRKK